MFYFWHFWDQNHWQIIPLLEWIYCVFICLDDDYFLLHIPWGLSVLVRFCYCGCKSCTVSDSDCSTIVSHDHVNWNTEDECLHRLTPVTHFLWFLLVSLASCIWKQTHLSNLIHAYIYKYIKLNESICCVCGSENVMYGNSLKKKIKKLIVTLYLAILILFSEFWYKLILIDVLPHDKKVRKTKEIWTEYNEWIQGKNVRR